MSAAGVGKPVILPRTGGEGHAALARLHAVAIEALPPGITREMESFYVQPPQTVEGLERQLGQVIATLRRTLEREEASRRELAAELELAAREVESAVENPNRTREELLVRIRTALGRVRSAATGLDAGQLDWTEISYAPPVKGVLPTARFLRAVEAHRTSPEAWCLCVFDLAGLERVHSRFGTVAADQVQRAVAMRLAAHVRALDLCGWVTPRELGILLQCGWQEAVQRISEAARIASRPLTVQSAGKSTVVTVPVQPAGAQYVPDETVEELLARVRLQLAK